MKSLNKKGFTIVELIIGLAILSVLLGAVAINGYAAYKNSLDQGVREDLKALTSATTMFMVANNGVAPCFTPEMAEGVDNTDAANVFCANTGYDFVQGNGTAVAAADVADASNTTSLDEDETVGEAFTFNNVLVPTYLDKLPLPRRGGQTYQYTKGIPNTSEGSSAFAYTGILAGSKAVKIIKDNVSVINVAVSDAAAANGVNITACSDALVDFDGDAALSLLAGAKNDNTQGLKYYSYSALKGVLVNETFADADNACDVYSDGQGILLGNFTDAQGAAGQSVTLTVNAK